MNREIVIAKRLKLFLSDSVAAKEILPKKADRLAYIWWLIAGNYTGRTIDGELRTTVLTQAWWKAKITNVTRGLVQERILLRDRGFVRIVNHARRKGFANEYGIYADDLSNLGRWMVGEGFAEQIGKHVKKHAYRKHEEESKSEYDIRTNVYKDITSLNLPDISTLGLDSNKPADNSTLISLSQIADGNFSVRHGIKGKRLYHPIASLSKNYRKHLTYEGKHLAGIDLSSSQIYFLAHLSGDEKLKEHCTGGDFYNDYLSGYLDDCYHRDVLKYTVISYLFDIERDYNPEKKQRFNTTKGKRQKVHGKGGLINSVKPDDKWVKKEITQHINRRLNDSGGEIVINLDRFREKRKEQVIYSYIRNRYRSLFRKYYPKAAEFITEITSKHKADSTNQTLAALLQREESAVMLEGLYARLYNEVGIRPLIPLHDGIYSTTDNLPILYQNSLKILQDMGHNPIVNQEKWE